MKTAGRDVRHKLDLLVRRERGRLIGGLVRHLGGAQLELAEDVAQEAVLQALSVWPYRGLPENPAAWLAKVARNKAIDRLRRENREYRYSDQDDRRVVQPVDLRSDFELDDQDLRLIFLCCHPRLKQAEQMALTLKVVSGFTARESARVFLLSPQTMAQRLVRAKRMLRETEPRPGIPLSIFELQERTPSVLKVIYLMFAVGYGPQEGDLLIRQDVAMEALRLSRELADRNVGNGPDASALAALLCFQASRFAVRSDDHGDVVLLQDQDRTKWDHELINLGLSYLQRARAATELSRFHLEAGIAAAHATAKCWDATDWRSIIRQYRLLESMTASPIVSLNASVALAQQGDAELAMEQLASLGETPAFEAYAPYFIACAEVSRQLGRDEQAAAYFDQAITCGVSTPVERLLERRLATCLQPA